MRSRPEKLGVDIKRPPALNFLSAHRALMLALLASLASDCTFTERGESDSSIAKKAEADACFQLESLDYRNIDHLYLHEAHGRLFALKEAVDNGWVKLEDVKRAIFPPAPYAYCLYFTDNFLENVLPERIQERAMRSDPYTESLRRFDAVCEIAKKNQVSHEMVFAAYARIFGADVDFNKTSNLYEEWGLGNMPGGREFKGDHKYAIDIYYFPFTEVGGEHIGPPALAHQPGVVIAAEDGWQGDGTPSGYIGGGLGARTGNGVIIFNPETSEYTSYAHFYDVSVSPGDIVRAREPIGRGGNTGNARLPCCGGHVHFEKHRSDGGRIVPVHKTELYELLSGRKPPG